MELDCADILAAERLAFSGKKNDLFFSANVC